MPWGDRNYRTRPFRILLDHSLGGLFAIHLLTAQPELFNAYIVISPSLHWDNQSPVNRAEAFLERAEELNASLFLIASDEMGVMLGAIRRFAGVLEEKAPRDFEWHFEHMPLEIHGTIPHRGTHQELEFIFADWMLRDPIGIYARDGIHAIERFYAESDKKYGYSRGITREIPISIARDMVETGQLDEAADLVVRYRDLMQLPYRALEFFASQLRKSACQVDRDR